MKDNFAIQLYENKQVRVVWDAEKEKYYFAKAARDEVEKQIGHSVVTQLKASDAIKIDDADSAELLE